LLDDVDGVERGAGRAAERVGALPSDGPEAEGELVVAGGLEGHGLLLMRAGPGLIGAPLNVACNNLSHPAAARERSRKFRQRCRKP